MFLLRPRAKEQTADPKSERNAHAFGTVRCPKCETKVEVRDWNPTLAEEFSVRCTTCGNRSFHTKSAITSTIVSKANG